jgi:hypothetical protein
VQIVGYKQPFFEGQATRIRLLSSGTLVLDMIDASSGKVVWRGEAHDATTPTSSAIERMIDEGIAQLLRGLPARGMTGASIAHRAKVFSRLLHTVSWTK